MEQVKLGSWLIQYNGNHNALRVLVNDEYLLDITTENVEQVLTAVDGSKGIQSTTLNVQPMVRQVLTTSVNYYTEDGEPEEFSILNYEIDADDLTSFHREEPVDVEIIFDSIGDAQNFYRDIWSHPSVDWILF